MRKLFYFFQIILILLYILFFNTSKAVDKKVDSISFYNKVNELQNQINEDKQTIESLRNEIKELNISKGYFFTILTTNTTLLAIIISVIVFFASFILNKIIKSEIKTEIELIRRELTNSLTTNMKGIDTKILQMDKKISDMRDFESTIEFNTCRSMYNISLSNKEYGMCVPWVIRIFFIIITSVEKNNSYFSVKNIDHWLDIAIQYLNKIIQEKDKKPLESLKENLKTMNEMLDNILELELKNLESQPKLKDKIKEIADKYNKYCYMDFK